MFSVHFLIYIMSFFQDVTCGIVVAVEAAGVFFFCPAGRAVGPASCSFSSRVTFSQD